MRNEPQRHVYLRSELRDLLAAVALAAASGNHSAEYAAGFEESLTAVAVGLGLEERPQRRQIITVEQPQRARLTGGK